MTIVPTYGVFPESTRFPVYSVENIRPVCSRGRRAKSIAFASMDETEFQQVYKAVLNVLWNWILFRKFSSPEEVENVAAHLLEFA